MSTAPATRSLYQGTIRTVGVATTVRLKGSTTAVPCIPAAGYAPAVGDQAILQRLEGRLVALGALSTGANTPSGYRDTAPPSSGAWTVGDVVVNSSPAAGGWIGWVCITAGTPGTWKGYGAIST
jgi:tripartite-type tricarboxylate transporter receptor subunit TctC